MIDINKYVRFHTENRFLKQKFIDKCQRELKYFVIFRFIFVKICCGI